MDDLSITLGTGRFASRNPRTALTGAVFTVNTKAGPPCDCPPPPPNATPAVNPFAGLPTIFTVLGKLGLELKRQEDTLPA